MCDETDAGVGPGRGRPLIADLLESMPDPVIGCDAAGLVVYWNRAAHELYGHSAEVALGTSAMCLLQTRVPRPLIEITEELTDLGRWQGRLTHTDAGGREHVVESRWTARYDDARALVGVFRIERELSDLGPCDPDPDRAGVDELARAQRLESLSQLAGGVAHDFNNALAIIVNYAAFVTGEIDRLRPAPSREQRRSIQADLMEIQTAARRAAELTHQLLAFSRQAVGAPVRLSINWVIEEIEDLLRHTIGEQISLTTELASDLEQVRADPGRLAQVLVNLAANARDAMPSGGTLTIDSANVTLDTDSSVAGTELAPGRYVRLRVSDTGTGMEPDVLARAFDPFFTTKPVGYGIGLGLSSVYGIITQASGHARFYSTPGVGTTFVALLPADVDDPEPLTPATPHAATERPGGRTILLVEDERALREVTRRILTGAGYEVLAAGSGDEAIKAVAAHAGTIDALLTDIVMPGMLGHDLAKRLRERLPGLRVIYMSGVSERLLGQTAPVEGARLIEKPFAAPELLEQVRAALHTAPPLGR
jgi:PAS domain S-box-containing protein